MLYIHKLLDLNRKSAEIESIQVIREIRSTSTLPVSEEFLQQKLAQYFATVEEIKLMDEALLLLPVASEKLVRLLAEKNPIHEPINVYRALQTLNQLGQPLQNNLAYCTQLAGLQPEFAAKVAGLLNRIPGMKSAEEISAVNAALSGIFEKVLRSKDILFSHQDIINEAHTGFISGLGESMLKGYLFHFTLEDELAKADFSVVRLRIPREKLDEAEALRQEVMQIQRGIDAAYSINMRAVELSILLYSYIKWASAKDYY